MAWDDPMMSQGQQMGAMGFGAQAPAQWGGLNLSGPGQSRNTPYQRPPPPVQQTPPPAQPTQPAPNNSPFPHVVGIQGLPLTTQNNQIQDFFKPAKATAVNLLGNGFGDIAFKTHEDAMLAMQRDRQMLNGASVN